MAGGLVQLLTDRGYTFEGTCNCDGFKTYKYKNGPFQFRWRINKNEFKIKHHGVTKTAWRGIDRAEEILTKLHATL
jgi:hypothetical protein